LERRVAFCFLVLDARIPFLRSVLLTFCNPSSPPSFVWVLPFFRPNLFCYASFIGGKDEGPFFERSLFLFRPVQSRIFLFLSFTPRLAGFVFFVHFPNFGPVVLPGPPFDQFPFLCSRPSSLPVKCIARHLFSPFLFGALPAHAFSGGDTSLSHVGLFFSRGQLSLPFFSPTGVF